jgi:hypothetical protein
VNSNWCSSLWLHPSAPGVNICSLLYSSCSLHFSVLHRELPSPQFLYSPSICKDLSADLCPTLCGTPHSPFRWWALHYPTLNNWTWRSDWVTYPRSHTAELLSSLPPPPPHLQKHLVKNACYQVRGLLCLSCYGWAQEYGWLTTSHWQTSLILGFNNLDWPPHLTWSLLCFLPHPFPQFVTVQLTAYSHVSPNITRHFILLLSCLSPSPIVSEPGGQGLHLCHHSTTKGQSGALWVWNG